MIRKTPWAGMELSQLMLGTVQFGLPYGIANRTGQPAYAAICDILTCAFEGGVNCLDTAAAYGESEAILGRALHELGMADQVTVVTKVHPVSDDLTATQAARVIEKSVRDSLRRLRLEVLPICLFHREGNWRYYESLLKLRDKGLLRRIGVSVMTPAAALEIVNSGGAEVLQVPASLVDRRFMRQGVFDGARRRGLALFARSIYLQGLLLLPEHEMAAELAEIVPVRRKLRALAQAAGLDLKALAVAYVLSLAGLTSALAGVETVEQMRENVRLFSRAPLEKALVRRIEAAVPELPDKILMPNQWPPRMPDIQTRRR